jgi:hypothetical protein
MISTTFKEGTDAMLMKNILNGPFEDHAEGTPMDCVKESECQTILRNFVRAACYDLPDRRVVELLRSEADKLSSK